MENQEENDVRQEASASTHVGVQIPENSEAEVEKRNDLLERSAILNIDDNEVFTPEDNVNDEESARAQEKTKETVKTMTQLRKLSSTNPAGAKESFNLPRRRSQKPTLANARQKYESALNEMSTELDYYLS